jgi:hypothetical protein
MDFNFLKPHKIIPILKGANDNEVPPYGGPYTAVCQIPRDMIYPQWWPAFVDCGKLNSFEQTPKFKVTVA